MTNILFVNKSVQHSKTFTTLCIFCITFCRTARQAERKARMQDRWNFLKEEINSIHKTKETARRNAERRKLFVSRSRGSYMSAHVLLNLLKELRKSDKMRGLPSILLLFRNKFNKFNNTGAQILDSIYHMTLKLIKNRIFGVKT